MDISRRRSSMLHQWSAELLILFSVLSSIHSAPVDSVDLRICPQESTHTTPQVQSWHNNIIPYQLSNNLTSDIRREILTTMALWEKRLCYSIAFIPSHPQQIDPEHFVHFVPGERCCLERGRMQDEVYVNNTCISDGILEDVMGALIGNTQNSQTNDDSHHGADTEMSTPGDPSNITVTDQNPTLIPSECQDTCIKQIIGRVNGKARHGSIFSPGYPVEYPHDADCVWRITVPDNAILQLTIQDFDTECRHDYLEMHHLNTAEGRIESLDRICGDTSHNDIITSHPSHLSVDTVILRFHSDTTYNRPGFNISYEFIENKHHCDVDMGGCSYRCVTDVATGIGKCVCRTGFRLSRSGDCKDVNECNTVSHGCEHSCRNTDGSYQCSCNEGYALSFGGRLCIRCQEEYNATEGVVTSIGYPGPYQDHQNCNYTIHILPEHVLKMTLFVDINRSPSCKSEFLKLEHGYFMYNRRLCGYLNNISYYIRDGNVTSTSLRFRTRDLNSVSEYPSGGFQVQFKQVLRSTVSVGEINQVHNSTHLIQYHDRPWLKLK